MNLRPSLNSLEDWNRLHSSISLYLAPSIIPSILTRFPVPADEKRQGWWDGVLWVLRCVGFASDIVFSLMAKKLNFSLIWPEYLLPFVWRVSHLPFGTPNVFAYFFLQAMAFFWPLFHKVQLCGVYDLKLSYGQILQSPLWSFAAPSGLSLITLLRLWLMPSLPGLWVLVGCPLLAGLLWCHILSIFY